MRATQLLLSTALLCFLAPAAVCAKEEGGGGGEDEFETEWIGLRIGAWYHPIMKMDVKVGGDPLPSGGGPLNLEIPDNLNAERDLGLKENPYSKHLVDFDSEAILRLELFFRTRLFSVAVDWVTPYEYRGERQLVREVAFGGISFPVNALVESNFKQAYLGAELQISIFDNQWFRISPLVAVRALAIDWEVKLSAQAGPLNAGTKGDTSDIDSPLSFGDWQVFPYPQGGIDLAVGYRSIIDVNLKLAAAYLNYGGGHGGIYHIEANATLYPIPFLGIQVGYLWEQYDISSNDDNPSDAYSFKLEYYGATISLVGRF